MIAKVHVKKNDQVVVIAGPDNIKGKQGKVLNVFPKTGKVMVEGVAYVSKHQKSRRQDMPGGIYQKERALDVSNVMLICPNGGKATRPATSTSSRKRQGCKDTKNVRVCKRCGAEIE
jgi:large subunit ribosomal protein L24